MSLKKNVIANYLGQGWSGLISLAFVPLYIKYMGIEAYGLIGIFVMLQAWLTLLDIGLSPTLGREMACFLGGGHTPQSIRDLLRSAEWVFTLIAVSVGLGVALSSSWLATEWLRALTLPLDTVKSALAITGWVVAVRLMGGLYRSAINGLHQHVWLNTSSVIFSTVRGVGSIGALVWVSPTIFVFFIFNGFVYLLEMFVLSFHLRRLLPTPPQPARFRRESLRLVWKYAAGTTAITLLATLLTQLDKLLLSKLLPLSEFGYYMFASTVAGAVYLVIMPISNVFRPYLAELVVRGESVALVVTYHKFAQLLTIMVVPSALVLCFFSDHFILLWTRDTSTTAAVSPLISLLVIGTMLNGLMNTPYALQLAYGKTHYAVWANAIAVLFLVPALYVGVTSYGAIAAPMIWILLNIGYLTVALPIMHRTLLPGEMWQWYVRDVAAPLFASITATTVIYFISPDPELSHPLTSVGILIFTYLITLISAILATPCGRDYLNNFIIQQSYDSSKKFKFFNKYK